MLKKCLLLFLASAQPLLAGDISGIVTEEGEPLSQVGVTLLDANSNVILTRSHTDSRGAYHFTVAPGSYKIRASLNDYADQWIKDVVVGNGRVNVDITMTPAVFVDSTAVPASDDCD